MNIQSLKFNIIHVPYHIQMNFQRLSINSTDNFRSMWLFNKTYKIYLYLKQFDNITEQTMSVSSMTVGGKIKFKIVMLGDQFVGKSSIIERFINDRFEQAYNATIGIDFLVRNLVHDNKTYRLQLWDTAGQERFRSLIPSYLKDSHCGLVVYDLSNKKTLDNIQEWLQFYKEHKEPHSISILIGNKSDLPEEENSCKEAEIQSKMKMLQIPHYKISAKTGEGIKQLFESVIEHINSSIKKQSLALVEENKEEEEGAGTVSTVLPSVPIKLDQQSAQKQEKNKKKSCC